MSTMTTSYNGGGESDNISIGKTACPSDAHEHPPTRRGIIVDLMVENADKFVDFIGKAVGAKEYFRFAGENGKVMHLALDIDGITAYVEELGNNMDTGAVKTPHVRLHLNSDDPVGMAKKLVKGGAKELTKCEEQSWGALYGQYMDPFGQIWSVSNASKPPLHDVPKELARKVTPWISVRDAAGFVAFLSEVFGAEAVTPPAKDTNGKIMAAEMTLNGGMIIVADHCGEDAGKQEPSVTIFYEAAADKAIPVANAFQANGGDIVELPSMKFWGQIWGRCKDNSGHTWGLTEPPAGPAPSEEDMAVDMKLGAKYDWKYVWTVEDMPNVHCFGETRSCLATGPAIAEEMKTMLAAAIAGAAKAGLEHIDCPMTAYYRWDCADDGVAHFTCGPRVAGGAAAPEGDGFGVRTVGACKYVTVVHVGPYENEKKTYDATFEWIKVKGYESRMPVLEMYVDDPKEVEAAKMRTKICIPIVPKGTPEHTCS